MAILPTVIHFKETYVFNLCNMWHVTNLTNHLCFDKQHNIFASKM